MHSSVWDNAQQLRANVFKGLPRGPERQPKSRVVKAETCGEHQEVGEKCLTQVLRALQRWYR